MRMRSNIGILGDEASIPKNVHIFTSPLIPQLGQDSFVSNIEIPLPEHKSHSAATPASIK